jgi:hypothetical protein
LYTKQHGIEANLFLAPGEGDDGTAVDGAVGVAGGPASNVMADAMRLLRG